jgi:hypothetical protein
VLAALYGIFFSSGLRAHTEGASESRPGFLEVIEGNREAKRLIRVAVAGRKRPGHDGDHVARPEIQERSAAHTEIEVKAVERHGVAKLGGEGDACGIHQMDGERCVIRIQAPSDQQRVGESVVPLVTQRRDRLTDPEGNSQRRDLEAEPAEPVEAPTV